MNAYACEWIWSFIEFVIKTKILEDLLGSATLTLLECAVLDAPKAFSPTRNLSDPPNQCSRFYWSLSQTLILFMSPRLLPLPPHPPQRTDLMIISNI
jgi:hypothetical protein